MTGFSAGHSRAVSYQTVSQASRARQFLGTPVRVWRVITWRRALQPVPAVYFAAAIVGLIVGLILGAFTSVPWWISPVALVILTWAFFFSTIWLRPHLHLTSLRTDLFSAVSPASGAVRQMREEADRIMSAALPIYGVVGLGLAVLGGEPKIGSSSWGPDGLQQVLIHYSDKFQVQVTVASQLWEDAGRIHVHDMLMNYRWNQTAGAAVSIEDHMALQERLEIHDGELTWETAKLTIDGVDVPAHRTSIDSLSAYYAQSDGYWVALLTPADAVTPALRRFSSDERRKLAAPVLPR